MKFLSWSPQNCRKSSNWALITGLLLLWLAANPGLSFQSASEDQQPTAKIVIPPPGEPGEALLVTGFVYASDGETPVAGAEIYVYHTDIHGYYSRDGADESNRRLSGRLVTDERGSYEIRTIRPAPYPNGGPPAHIHFEIKPPGGSIQYFDLWFDDDPSLSRALRERYAEKGPFGRIQAARAKEDGVQYFQRFFKLKGI